MILDKRFYGFLFFMLIRSARTQLARLMYANIGIVLILAIGFSRLYLDVHYLSDVWGGYVVGGGWLIFAVFIYEIRRRTIDK